MVASAWIDTVWRMHGAKSPVVGRIDFVDGEVMTLSVIGLDDRTRWVLKFCPVKAASADLLGCALDVLLRNWYRVETGASRRPASLLTESWRRRASSMHHLSAMMHQSMKRNSSAIGGAFAFAP